MGQPSLTRCSATHLQTQAWRKVRSSTCFQYPIIPGSWFVSRAFCFCHWWEKCSLHDRWPAAWSWSIDLEIERWYHIMQVPALPALKMGSSWQHSWTSRWGRKSPFASVINSYNLKMQHVTFFHGCGYTITC